MAEGNESSKKGKVAQGFPVSTSRKKPKFYRRGWHKLIKLGSKSKSKRKWRKADGIHNKIRLGVKGQDKRPKIGWGAENKTKNFVKGMSAVRVENVRDLENVGKDRGIIIANVGKKKKMEIMKKAEEKKILVLNRYKKNQGPLSSQKNVEAGENKK